MEIPLYQRSVTPTTQTGGAPTSPEAASAPWKALAGVGKQVEQIGFGFAKQQKEAKQRSDALAAQLEGEKQKAEAKLLDLEISEKIGVAKNIYQSGLETRTDTNNFGTEEDKIAESSRPLPRTSD